MRLYKAVNLCEDVTFIDTGVSSGLHTCQNDDSSIRHVLSCERVYRCMQRRVGSEKSDIQNRLTNVKYNA